MDVPEIDIAEAARRHAAGAVVIDVRELDEYLEGHVPGAPLIPLSLVPDRVHEAPADGEVLVICKLGGRSRNAATFLRGQGSTPSTSPAAPWAGSKPVTGPSPAKKPVPERGARGQRPRRGDPPPGAVGRSGPPVAEIVEELVEVEAFGVDTEFHREKTYFPQLALVQLSWNDQKALVDPLTVDLTPFARALEGPATVVMHAASQDLEVLHRACGVLPRDLFDTQLAAGFCGHSLPSLSALVEKYYDVHLPKGDRLTDWLRRPLNDDQRTYAASDVEYLLGLQATKLTATLSERGRLDWALDECQALRAKGQVIRDPDEAWLRIKEARSLRGADRGRGPLGGGLARASGGRSAGPAGALRPVRPRRGGRRPAAPQGPGRPGPHPWRSTSATPRGGWARASSKPSPPVETRTRPCPAGPAYELDRKYRPAVALVAAWVSQLARDLEIETSLVATRADIESLLAGDPDARLTRGWRADLVGERIRRLVEGEAALAFDGRGTCCSRIATGRTRHRAPATCGSSVGHRPPAPVG